MDKQYVTFFFNILDKEIENMNLSSADGNPRLQNVFLGAIRESFLK